MIVNALLMLAIMSDNSSWNTKLLILLSFNSIQFFYTTAFAVSGLCLVLEEETKKRRWGFVGVEVIQWGDERKSINGL